MSERRTVMIGFSLAAVFLILNGSDFLLLKFGTELSGSALYIAMMAVSFIAFALPAIIISTIAGGKNGVRLRLKMFKLRSLPFIILFSVCVSLLSFILNYTVQSAFGSVQAETLASESGSAGTFLVFLATALAPALFEELYLRGVIFSAYERFGTVPAILLSAFAFAMMHASMTNFVGPLVAGLAYAYITYITDSIWPAVICHLMNNVCVMLMSWLLRTYSAFGLWPYFLAACILLFLILCWMALSALETLIARGAVPRMASSSVGAAATLLSTFLSPGFVLFAALFLLRTVFSG